MYQNHLKTCGYCQNQKEKEKDHKNTKLAELGEMIRGTRPIPANKGASSYSYSDSYSYPRLTLRRYPILIEKQKKLREIGNMIRGL